MPKAKNNPMFDFNRDILPNCKRVGECLIWQGKLSGRTGYGQMKRWINGKEKYFKVHRITYELKHGSTDLFILHSCDTPACTEDSHLFAGTTTDNMRDMSRKGRGRPQGRTDYVCHC